MYHTIPPSLQKRKIEHSFLAVILSLLSYTYVSSSFEKKRKNIRILRVLKSKSLKPLNFDNDLNVVWEAAWLYFGLKNLENRCLSPTEKETKMLQRQKTDISSIKVGTFGKLFFSK